MGPLTSTIRGVPPEARLDESDGTKQPCAVNLHTVTTVETGNLGRRVAHLSDARMREVRAG